MHDPPNGRKSYPGALKLFRQMQTLKYPKQFIDILHVEAGAIIPHENLDLIVGVHASDLDFGSISHPGEFDRIGDKVGDHQPQHGTVTVTHGKRIDPPHDISLPRVLPDLRDDLFDELVKAH